MQMERLNVNNAKISWLFTLLVESSLSFSLDSLHICILVKKKPKVQVSWK